MPFGPGCREQERRGHPGAEALEHLDQLPARGTLAVLLGQGAELESFGDLLRQGLVQMRGRPHLRVLPDDERSALRLAHLDALAGNLLLYVDLFPDFDRFGHAAPLHRLVVRIA